MLLILSKETQIPSADTNRKANSIIFEIQFKNTNLDIKPLSHCLLTKHSLAFLSISLQAELGHWSLIPEAEQKMEHKVAKKIFKS